MGCSNTKFPTTAAADHNTPISNLLSMSNSIEQAAVEGGEKLLNQANDALNQASEIIENATEMISGKGSVQEAASVNLEALGETEESESQPITETPVEEPKEVDGTSDQLENAVPEIAEENEEESKDVTDESVAICPPNESPADVQPECEESSAAEETEEAPTEAADETNDDKSESAKKETSKEENETEETPEEENNVEKESTEPDQ